MRELMVVLLVLLCYFTIERLKFDRFKSSIDGMNYKIVSFYDSNTHKKAANKMAILNIFVINLLRHLKKRYTIGDEGTRNQRIAAVNLLERYNPDVIKENMPFSKRYTSYVFNKGDSIGFCLREKTSGKNHFHNINHLKFVVLHELSHLADDGYGHTKRFWGIFKWLIQEAVSAGIYYPVNYSLKPQEYCGIMVTYSPYFDKSLYFA